LQHGCEGFEFDLRKSSDGVPVVCHDPVLRGMSVDKTLAANLGVPTLEDVVRTFAARAFLDIELKVSGLEMSTISALRSHSPRQGYVVSSFLPEVLSATHKLDPTVPLGLICDDRRNLDHWPNLPIDWLIPQFNLVDEALITRCRDAGTSVMVWIVNREICLRKISAMGADAVITDETALAAVVLSHPEDAH
jgi:glycerophosphoryl diester phosphodiesterase